MKNKKVIRLTESELTRLVERVVNEKNLLNEDHEKGDKGKINYIKGALKNLSSKNLDKVYLMVEKLDPNYGIKGDMGPN